MNAALSDHLTEVYAGLTISALGVGVVFGMALSAVRLALRPLRSGGGE